MKAAKAHFLCFIFVCMFFILFICYLLTFNAKSTPSDKPKSQVTPVFAFVQIGPLITCYLITFCVIIFSSLVELYVFYLIIMMRKPQSKLKIHLLGLHGIEL